MKWHSTLLILLCLSCRMLCKPRPLQLMRSAHGNQHGKMSNLGHYNPGNYTQKTKMPRIIPFPIRPIRIFQEEERNAELDIIVENLENAEREEGLYSQKNIAEVAVHLMIFIMSLEINILMKCICTSL